MSLRPHDELELMSQRRLRDSLEATRTMLRQAQQIAAENYAALSALANEFCPAELQARQAAGADPGALPVAELTGLLQARFKSLRLVAGNGSAHRLAELAAQIATLQAELETQRRTTAEAEERAQALTRQVASLERSLAEAHQQSSAPALNQAAREGLAGVPDEASGSWLKNWRLNNRNYRRDLAVITAIGRQGGFLISDLEDELSGEGGMSQSTVRRAVQACSEAGLLAIHPAASTGGRPAHVIALTERGRALYQTATGAEAIPSQHAELLKAHKSERHLALILKVADEFYRLGYEVERQPQRISLDEKRTFQPDLLVRKDGQIDYLEIERGGGGKDSLPGKWELSLQAVGSICVVADNLGTLRAIQGSVAQWATFEGKDVLLKITTLEHLQASQPGESPWYKVREYKVGL